MRECVDEKSEFMIETYLALGGFGAFGTIPASGSRFLIRVALILLIL